MKCNEELSKVKPVIKNIYMYSKLETYRHIDFLVNKYV